MHHASDEYDSVYGKIATDWSESSGSFSLKVTRPGNTTGTIYLPALPNSNLYEHGTAMQAQQQDGQYVVQTGSGRYEFEVR